MCHEIALVISGTRRSKATCRLACANMVVFGCCLQVTHHHWLAPELLEWCVKDSEAFVATTPSYRMLHQHRNPVIHIRSVTMVWVFLESEKRFLVLQRYQQSRCRCCRCWAAAIGCFNDMRSSSAGTTTDLRIMRFIRWGHNTCHLQMVTFRCKPRVQLCTQWTRAVTRHV